MAQWCSTCLPHDRDSVHHTMRCRQEACGPSYCCFLSEEQGWEGRWTGCRSGKVACSARSTPGKTPRKRILNVTALIDAKSWSSLKYTGSKINEWKADFTQLLPIYAVYIDITIRETQGGISLFLTVDAGIKMFLCEVVTMAWSRGKIRPF